MKNTSIPITLKTLRLSKSLTLDDLAALSKVSRSMISKIEREDATPTTTTLGKLAEALDVSVSQLIGGKSENGTVLIPASKQPVFLEDKTGFERRSLSPLYRGRGIDVALNTLPSNTKTGPFPSHRAGVEEHLFLISGNLRVRVGVTQHDLAEGDFLFYPADEDHTFENLSSIPATFVIVIDSTQLR